MLSLLCGFVSEAAGAPTHTAASSLNDACTPCTRPTRSPILAKPRSSGARFKAENTKLRERLAKSDKTIDELTNCRSQALPQLAAQHEEIVGLREIATATTWVSDLPAPRTTMIGSCS